MIGPSATAIYLAPTGDGIEQLIDDIVDAAAELLNRARRKRFAHERAQSRVVRRVGDEHREGRTLLGREIVVVPQGGSDIAVTGEQPAAARLVPMDGIRLPQRPVVGVRIGQELLREPVYRGDFGHRFGGVRLVTFA